MREPKPFGKASREKRELPNDKELKKAFGIVNNGCDSKQIVEFIKKTTMHEITDLQEEENDRRTVRKI